MPLSILGHAHDLHAFLLRCEPYFTVRFVASSPPTSAHRVQESRITIDVAQQ
jgi:hypothetical protein